MYYWRNTIRTYGRDIQMVGGEKVIDFYFRNGQKFVSEVAKPRKVSNVFFFNWPFRYQRERVQFWNCWGITHLSILEYTSIHIVVDIFISGMNFVGFGRDCGLAWWLPRVVSNDKHRSFRGRVTQLLYNVTSHVNIAQEHENCNEQVVAARSQIICKDYYDTHLLDTISERVRVI